MAPVRLIRGACWVTLWVFLLAAIAMPARAETQGERREIVILLDNHIFTDSVFSFNEAYLRENIRNMLAYVRPLRTVVFAVGHDGHAQYPSRYFPARRPSAAFPQLAESDQDLLQIWREETRRAGSELIIYVSTLRNDALTALRPDLMRIFGNGARATVIDHNSAFLEDILLPGLQEIIDRYDPDGFFLDADYWTLHESWHPQSVARFSQQYGVVPPKDYGDSSYDSFVRFTYDSYRNDYVERLSAFFRGQARPLNWSINAAFTIRDPSAAPDNLGTVAVDLPFFALGEAYVESLFGQRLSQASEIVYPLFAQSEGSYVYQYKSAAQLRQELAVAIANRSLISFYLPVGRDGAISVDRLQPAIRAYDELASAIGISHRAPTERLVADVAVVNNNADAIMDRRFSTLLAASLDLFERGVFHAVISDAMVAESAYSHYIFPGVSHLDDADLVLTLAERGRRVFWRVDRASANPESLAALAALERLTSRPGAANCSNCVIYRHRSGGEVWVTPEAGNDQMLNAFLASTDPEIQFQDKASEVFALAYRDGERLVMFLTSTAWGGYAIGRHTLFDDLEDAPAVRVRLRQAHSCTQHTLDGAFSLPRSATLRLRPFTAITRIECTRQR